MSSDFGVAAVVSDAAVATATVPFDVGNVAAVVTTVFVGDTAVVESHARSNTHICIHAFAYIRTCQASADRSRTNTLANTHNGQGLSTDDSIHEKYIDQS